MRRLALLIAMISGSVAAAPPPAGSLQRYTDGKAAGAPVECITPESAVRPEIVDGTAIVWFVTGTTYVNRFDGRGCPALRRDRQIVTTMVQGRLCRNDPVRVVQAPGGTGFGFCALGAFTPYHRAR